MTPSKKEKKITLVENEKTTKTQPITQKQNPLPYRKEGNKKEKKQKEYKKTCVTCIKLSVSKQHSATTTAVHHSQGLGKRSKHNVIQDGTILVIDTILRRNERNRKVVTRQKQKQKKNKQTKRATKDYKTKKAKTNKNGKQTKKLGTLP